MPYGKGTYGKTKGRPPAKKTTKLTEAEKKKIMLKKK
tara:strand:+ start:573 stop:683 length:111 start_codon:yes stop_codon:yes gene_type:complete